MSRTNWSNAIYSGDSHNSITSSAFDFDNIANHDNLSPIINRQNSEISIQRSHSSSVTVQQEMRNVGKSVPYDPEISSCFLKRDDFKRHLEKFTNVYFLDTQFIVDQMKRIIHKHNGILTFQNAQERRLGCIVNIIEQQGILSGNAQSIGSLNANTSNVPFIQAEMRKNVYNLYPKGFFIAELAYRQNINPMLPESKYCWEFTGDRYYSRYVPYKFHLRTNPIKTKNDLQAELSNFIESNNFQKIDLNEALLPFVPFKGQIVSFCSLPQRSCQYASPEAFDVQYLFYDNDTKTKLGIPSKLPDHLTHRPISRFHENRPNSRPPIGAFLRHINQEISTSRNILSQFLTARNAPNFNDLHHVTYRLDQIVQKVQSIIQN